MNIRLKPRKLAGRIDAVSSKSYAHRIIVASMLSDRETEITINGFSDDIMRTLGCVEALGGKYTIVDNIVRITPVEGNKKNAILDCGESGTTARIMLPVVTAVSQSATLTGSGRLPDRPFSEVTAVLKDHGVLVSSDRMPIKVEGKPEHGDFSIPGDISSQYVTGLLFLLPLLAEESTITLTTHLKSSAYVDITVDVLKTFGIDVRKQENVFYVPSAKYKTPLSICVEGDWSNSAFWFAANKLGSEISVENLNYTSRQGDRRIVDILDANIIDVDEIPDLFPVLAVLAASRNGKTTLTNASRLRLKESDRIEAVMSMLTSLGAKAEAGADYLTVYGTGSLRGGIVKSFNDHRIVMSAAIAATICKDDVIIEDFEAVNKSYPSFFEDYKKLGGDFNVF